MSVCGQLKFRGEDLELVGLVDLDVERWTLTFFFCLTLWPVPLLFSRRSKWKVQTFTSSVKFLYGKLQRDIFIQCIKYSLSISHVIPKLYLLYMSPGLASGISIRSKSTHQPSGNGHWYCGDQPWTWIYPPFCIMGLASIGAKNRQNRRSSIIPALERKLNLPWDRFHEFSMVDSLGTLEMTYNAIIDDSR